MKHPIFKVLFFTVLLITACSDKENMPQDSCEMVSCGDNSTCNDGICICDTGYEKDINSACTLRTYVTKIV